MEVWWTSRENVTQLCHPLILLAILLTSIHWNYNPKIIMNNEMSVGRGA